MVSKEASKDKSDSATELPGKSMVALPEKLNPEHLDDYFRGLHMNLAGVVIGMTVCYTTGSSTDIEFRRIRGNLRSDLEVYLEEVIPSCGEVLKKAKLFLFRFKTVYADIEMFKMDIVNVHNDAKRLSTNFGGLKEVHLPFLQNSERNMLDANARVHELEEGSEASKIALANANTELQKCTAHVARLSIGSIIAGLFPGVGTLVSAVLAGVKIIADSETEAARLAVQNAMLNLGGDMMAALAIKHSLVPALTDYNLMLSKLVSVFYYMEIEIGQMGTLSNPEEKERAAMFLKAIVGIAKEAELACFHCLDFMVQMKEKLTALFVYAKEHPKDWIDVTNEAHEKVTAELKKRIQDLKKMFLLA